MSQLPEQGWRSLLPEIAQPSHWYLLAVLSIIRAHSAPPHKWQVLRSPTPRLCTLTISRTDTLDGFRRSSTDGLEEGPSLQKPQCSVLGWDHQPRLRVALRTAEPVLNAAKHLSSPMPYKEHWWDGGLETLSLLCDAAPLLGETALNEM